MDILSYILGKKSSAGLPIEVDRYTKMNALLVAENVGKCYKYTGNTEYGFVNNDLYIVEET